MIMDSAIWGDLIGEPFQINGRGNPGYDCYGLLIEVFRRRGIIIPDLVYDDDRAQHAFLMATATRSDWRECPVKPGAGLLFLEDGIPGHVGVAIDDDRFIHSSLAMGQVSIGRLSRLSGLKLIAAYEPVRDRPDRAD